MGETENEGETTVEYHEVRRKRVTVELELTAVWLGPPLSPEQRLRRAEAAAAAARAEIERARQPGSLPCS